MTCVAAMIDPSTSEVWIGGDSRGTRGSAVDDGQNEKIWSVSWNNETIVFGAAGPRVVNQFVRYSCPLPDKEFKEEKDDFTAYLFREWLEPVREELLKKNLSKTKDGVVDCGSVFIIGRKGSLYLVDSTLSLSELTSQMISIGSGGSFAHGVLWALDDVDSSLSTKERITLAITGASNFCDGVGGRIDILST
jgi:ATP-dependent protease HslVU (ClpYQ) peptidase subunit